MTNDLTFGARLKRLRLSQKLSQTELAGEGLSSSYISLLESGNREPSLHVIELIAQRLGVTTRMLQHGVSSPDAGEVTRTQRVVTTVSWSFPEVHELLLTRIITAVHEWRAGQPGADARLLEQLHAGLDDLEERVSTFELVSLCSEARKDLRRLTSVHH